MIITICDVPERLRADVERVGGEVVRSWNELMDVQFKSHKLMVRGNYVKVRDSAHNFVVLCDNEFSNIYVQEGGSYATQSQFKLSNAYGVYCTP